MRLATACFVALSIVLFAGPSLAGPGDKEALQGINAARGGFCKRAIPLLESAEKQRHRPSSAVALADCYVKRGDLLKARELYHKVAADVNDPAYNARDRAAITSAKKKLARLDARLPTLAVAPVAPYEGLSIEVNGEDAGDLKAPRQFEPGRKIVVVARAEGYEEHRETITLKEKQRRVIKLRLKPKPGVKKAPVEAPGAKKPEAKKPVEAPGAKKPGAQKPEVKKPGAKKPEAKRPSAEAKKPSAEAKKPSAEAKKPSAEAKKPSAEAKKPSAKKTAAKAPSTKKPEAKAPSTKKPAAKAPSTKKPSAKVPSTKKPEAKKPSAEAKRPSAEAKKPSAEAKRPSAEAKKPSAEAKRPSAEAPRAEPRPDDVPDKRADVPPVPPAWPDRRPSNDFWLGAGYQGFVVPKFLFGLLGEGGRDVVFPGADLSLTAKLGRRVDLVVSISYASLRLPETPFKPHGHPDTDYEIVESDLQALQASARFVWDLPLDRKERFSFRLGAGLGVGWTFLGDLYRTQAYPGSAVPGDPSTFVPGDPYTYVKCRGPNDPEGSFRYCNQLDYDADHYPGYVEPSWFTRPKGRLQGLRPLVYPWVVLPEIGFAVRPWDNVAFDLRVGASATGLLTGLGVRFAL